MKTADLVRAPSLAVPTARLTHQLVRSQRLPLPVDEVFPFYADPWNLEQITPPHLRFRILRAPDDGLRRGSLIDYRLSLYGVPVRWRTRISAWEPGAFFVDEALRGPYRLWIHLHEFRPVEGGTEIRDRVFYQLPFPPFGEIARGWVASELEGIFDYRQRAVAERFGGAPAAPIDTQP